MDRVVKRKLEEIIQQYKLEPALADVFVEGICDKLFLEHFFEVNEINNVIVHAIDEIDFSEMYLTKPFLVNNNKLRVIELAEKLRINFANSLGYVACIIDADFDHINGVKQLNQYLLTTDFSCMESYYFDEECIDNFYRCFFYSLFPVSAKVTIIELGKLLRVLFLIRYSIDKLHGEFGLTNHAFNYEIKKGKILFDPENILEGLLISKGKQKDIKNYTNTINEAMKKLSNDPRSTINGHDFCYHFGTYLRKTKERPRATAEIVERVLPRYVSPKSMTKFKLFEKLAKKYK